MALKNSSKLFLLSSLSGVLLSLSWPERGWTPLIFIAFIPLLFVEHWLSKDATGKSTKRFFGLAYLAMLLWNSLTTWWIWNSTGVGAIVAIAVNSMFLTVVWWLFHFTKKKCG